MAAIAVALLYGGWVARAAAAVDLVLLIFIGQVFAGLGRLEVAPVGHLTALLTGAVTATLLRWHQPRRKARVLNRLRFRILPRVSPRALIKLSIEAPSSGFRQRRADGRGQLPPP
jgi:hypothetical protein